MVTKCRTLEINLTNFADKRYLLCFELDNGLTQSGWAFGCWCVWAPTWYYQIQNLESPKKLLCWWSPVMVIVGITTGDQMIISIIMKLPNQSSSKVWKKLNFIVWLVINQLLGVDEWLINECPMSAQWAFLITYTLSGFIQNNFWLERIFEWFKLNLL